VTDRATNVDPAELERFGAVGGRWWDPEGECAPLHAINPLRLAWIERRAGGLAGKAVADIGCGGGLLSEAMARQGAHVVGIDLAREAIDAARAHADEHGVEVEYRLASASDLAEQWPGGFDVVTCMEMLEHVPEPAAVVADCARLVRPGGVVVLSTINRNLKSWLEAIVAAEYVLGLLPRGTHTYARLIRPHELARWCRDAGLESEATSGITYDPLRRNYHLCRSVDVNYMLACRARADIDVDA